MSEIDVRAMALDARAAGRQLALSTTSARNTALRNIAARLATVGPELWEANRADLAYATEAGIAPALLDRAALNPKRVQSMIDGCNDVAALPDPLGEVFDGRTLPNGMVLAKKRVPLGVLATIFESRPNVTIDIGALAIKSGNAVIMRGGKESLQTNTVLTHVVRDALADSGLPVDAVQLIASPDRDLVPQLLALDDLIDLVIPRGGPGLQALVKDLARMPVAYGGIGVCHLFVDASADPARSLPLINNAKVQAPSVCNALDTVLVHRDVAARFVPAMVANLNASGVKVYLDAPSLATLDAAALAAAGDLVASAQPEHFGHEFLSLQLSVKVVDSLDEAIAHIQRYGTNHTDGILTDSVANAERFLNEVDSAATYVNCSTRFTDGGVFGLGAEVAISTQRLHARGPMGLRELTTYKWIGRGDYHLRP
ncbi:MAG: glutamate-5-semialdehyde dehydrogenase [Anaerolineales bacterium]